MGLRFRKSVKIAPGVKVNFNKKSTGVTFGGKGFHYTVNSKGKRTTSVGIPGTGLSYSTTSGGNSKKQKTYSNQTERSADTMDTATTKKWYQKTGYIILLLVLFFPVGLFLMWKYTNWSKNIKIAISAVLALFFGISIIASGGSDEPTDATVSDTGIESLNFIRNEPLELEIGEKDRSYFEVDYTNDFSEDDISFISSNEAVATFSYDKTVADKYIYYQIEAKGAGTATVYVQTTDGIIKSDEIQITVTGEEVTSKAPETTTKDETTTTQEITTNAPETTTAETTTVAETTTERQTTTERETTTEKPAGRTVYVTPSGERYHFTPDCGGKNSRATSIDNVGGRTPCQKCAQ